MLISLIRGSLSFEEAIVDVIAILFIVFLILPFHEWAHAFTALKLGDTSVKYRGRLTLNPLAHIDPFGALALLLFGFGWAKPVPVDSRNFKKPKLYMGITALMGPVANILAALAGALIYCGIERFAPDFLMYTTVNGVAQYGFGNYLVMFLDFYISVNITLAVFNLLPIPPLDGSKILFIFLPDRLVSKFYQYQQFISIGILVLLWVGVLSWPISFLSNYLYQFVMMIARLPFGL